MGALHTILYWVLFGIGLGDESGLALAEAAFVAGDFRGAREHFEAHLDESPDSVEALLGMARCHAQQVQPAATLEWLRKAVAHMDDVEAVGLDAREDLHPVRAVSFEVEDFFWELRARVARQRMQGSREAAIGIIWPDGARDFVNAVQISPDGERLLTVGVDHNAHLWDRVTGDLKATLDGHELTTQVQFSPDGRHVVTRGARDGKVQLWDGDTGRHLELLDPGQAVFTHVAFSRGTETRWVVTTRSDGVVQVWGLVSPGLRREWQGPASARLAEFHPVQPNVLAVAYLDGTVMRYDLTQEAGEPLPGKRGEPLDLVFGPRGRHLAVADRDGQVDVFDQAGELHVRLSGHEGAVWQVLFNAAGDRLATVSPKCMPTYSGGLFLERFRQFNARIPFTPRGDGSVRLWNLNSGEELCVARGDRHTYYAAFHPSGDSLATLHDLGRIEWWKADDGTHIDSLDCPPMLPYVLRFSPDGGRLAAVGNSGTFIWSIRESPRMVGNLSDGLDVALMNDDVIVATQRGALEYSGPRLLERRWYGPRFTRPVHGLWTGMGDEVVVVCEDGSIRFFDATHGDSTREPLRAPLAYHLSVGAQGSIVAAGQPGNWLFDAVDGELLWHKARHGVPGFTSVLSHDASGERIAVSQPDGVEVYHAEGARLRKLPIPARHGAAYLGWTDDTLWVGSAPLVPGAGAPRVLGFELPEGRPVVDFEPEGGYLAMNVDGGAGLIAVAGTDHAIRTYDLEGNSLGAPMLGHANRVRGMSVDPLRPRILSFGDDHTARIWDLDTGECLATMRSNRMPRFAAYSPNGDWIVMAGDDSVVRLFDAETGESLGEPLRGHEGPIIWTAFSPEGDRVLTLGNDGVAQIWDVVDGVRRLTRAHYGEPLPPLAAFAPDGPMPKDDWLVLGEDLAYQSTPRADSYASVRAEDGRVYPLSCYANRFAANQLVARGSSNLWNSRREPPPELFLDERRSRVEVEDRRYTFGAWIGAEYWNDRCPVRLHVNGHSIPQDRIQVERQGRDYRLEVRTRIPADTNLARIELEIENSRGIRSPRHTLDVHYKPAQRDLFLVAFGVDTYDEPALNLQSSVKDVESMIAEFRKQEGETGYYRQIHVMKELNADLTRGDPDRILHQFLRTAGEEDMILVLVAGHATLAGNGSYYFLTSECTPEDPYEGITRDQLFQMVRAEDLKPRRRILLIDTCHAGGAGRGVSVPSTIEEASGILEESGGGTYVIAAGGRFERAGETGDNGLFTSALLEGLRGAADAKGFGNEDGFVSVEEWYRFAKERVLEQSGQRQKVNTPLESGEDFPIARINDP